MSKNPIKNWFATTSPGLEPVVLRELSELGLNGTVSHGGVSFRCDVAEGIKLSHLLRTPSKVLLRLSKGKLTRLGELRHLMNNVKWTELLSKGTAVSIRVRTSKTRLRSDVLEQKSNRILRGILNWEDGEEPTQELLLRVHGDKGELSIDTSDRLLHKRGWRLRQGKASLRENWAASLLFMAGWDSDETLLDPFCGSGTICIEAARFAQALPAQLKTKPLRCLDWKTAAPIRSIEKRIFSNPYDIIGSDNHRQSLETALENARRAGVKVKWLEREISSIEPPSQTGLIATNPPYGKRLGVNVDGVYRRFGERLMERFSGWRLIFLCLREDLAHAVHPQSQLMTVFQNGGIRTGVWVVEQI